MAATVCSHKCVTKTDSLRYVNENVNVINWIENYNGDFDVVKMLIIEIGHDSDADIYMSESNRKLCETFNKNDKEI